MTRPKIGQFCKVKAEVKKYNRYCGERHDPTIKRQYPRETRYEALTPLGFSGYYIGCRTIHEGVTNLEWDGDDYVSWSYPVFKRRKSREVWLFVRNERSTPRMAYPEHVEIEAAE